MLFRSRITRPEAKIEGLDEIVKVDQFFSRVDKAFDRDHTILSARKVIGSDTLENFTRTLAAQHRPASFDWHRRYLSPKKPSCANEPATTVADNAEDAKVQNDSIDKMSSKFVCESCGKAVTDGVANYCAINKPRFASKIYCMACQRDIPET